MDASDASSPAVAALRVLASGSSGNCSVLALRCGDRVKAFLIDAGLSPRRTQQLLGLCGLEFDDIAGVLLTHLDTDHWNSGWTSAWPRRWLLWLSARHAAFAQRKRLTPRDAVRPFEEAPFEPVPGVAATPIGASHDELGVTSFRLDVRRGETGGSIGFATDLGRVPERLIQRLHGVDVLAIESNYCPHMQMASSRPWHVKQRIMGGHGHLSNDQALHAITAIAPREHVVLLHLSRQCNDPGLVASLHAGSDYALTLSAQDEPSRWVSIPARNDPRPVVTVPRGEQLEMFPAGAHDRVS